MEGVLTDVTSAVLSDPTDTFGVRRNDTLATVVANNTAMVRQSTGIYQYSFASLDSVAYTSYVEYVYLGATYRYENPIAATVSTTAWYYADQTDLEVLLGVEATRQLSLPAAASTDTIADASRILAAGLWADQYMDSRLSVLGYKTPLVVSGVALSSLASTHATRILMKDASVRLVAWKLNEPRMLTEVSKSRQAPAIDIIMAEHRKAADFTLRLIAMRQIALTADRTYTRPRYGEVFIPSGTIYPDEDGVLVEA